MRQYVIIGNGVAGTTAAEAIRQIDPSAELTIITDEDLPFYFRIRLPEFIAGAIPEEKLLAKEQRWYDDQKITLITNRRVSRIDPQAKVVVIEENTTVAFDRLLIATGSHSFVPPFPGTDLNGVFTLRNIGDARAIKEYAARSNRVVAIGGGLLGLEAGHALRKLGKEVMVVEYFDRLLPRQLDREGASRLQTIMEDRLGFSFRLGAKTKRITGTDRVTGVELESGETLPCELVLISAGVRPNLTLATALGLTVDKGIVVNNRLETSRPGIFAAGDVAEFGNAPPPGIWPAAMQQGKIAGTAMAGGDATYAGTIVANRLKVVGINLAAAGDIDADNRLQSKVIATASTYRKIVIDQNRIVGCILLGDIDDYGKLSAAIAAKTELHQLDRRLLDPGANGA